MALNKRVYVDGETIITAQNLNDIQDEIIAHESNKVPITRTVNSKPLSSNITLSADDIGYNSATAYTSGTVGKAMNDLNNKVSGVTMESVAINEQAYKDVFFGEYNVFSMFYPDSGTFTPLGINAGSPSIVNSFNNTTLNHNLVKAFGSSSQQFQLYSNRGIGIVSGHSYYVAMYINVTRYSAGKCGFLFGDGAGLGDVTLQRTTSGFELLSSVKTATASATIGCFVGTANSANADCYIACPVVIDMTALGLSNTTANKNALDDVFKKYVIMTDDKDFYTRRFAKRKQKLATVIMGQTSSANRFAAAGQLNAIARKKLINPFYSPKSSEYDLVTMGMVAELPEPNTAMYERADFNVLFAVADTTTARPASTIKVLNAATALYYNLDLNEQYTIESGDVLGGSGSAYAAGDVVTIKDLLYAMFLESSNTCANALGTMTGRKILHNPSASNTNARNAFVSTMSERLQSIGGRSWSGNASGYNSTAVLTPTDLLRIVIEASSFGEILRVWNKKSYTMKIQGTNARNIDISTTVEDTSYERQYYIIGGKTGTGDEIYNVILVSEPIVAAI